MFLVSARVENFKLLEDVRIDFSTDPKHPLTVIRAENGSGKTSLLYALQWAFYGMAGLGPKARDLRLTSSDKPAGAPVTVSVYIEFGHVDDNNDMMRYRLIRSLKETPGTGNKVDRGPETIRLYSITDAGDELVDPPEPLIAKLIPRNLMEVFFTDGDAVQTFISASDTQRQTRVEKSIRLLLSLDELEVAVGDFDAVHKIRRAALADADTDVSQLQKEWSEADDELKAAEAAEVKVATRLESMEEQKAAWEKELNALRGVGDLDEINRQIEQLEASRRGHEAARDAALTRMKAALKAEPISWTLMREPLDKSMVLLSSLADRNIIPGTSVEVLTDRLEMELCICGEPLPHGSDRRSKVEELRDEQRNISEQRARLTQLFHTARQAAASEDAREASGEDFLTSRARLQTELTEARDRLKACADQIAEYKERRSQIDDDRIRDLTEKLDRVHRQINEAHGERGELRSRITVLQEQAAEADRRSKQAEESVKVSDQQRLKYLVAQDLLALTRDTLATLKNDYVDQVSARMNTLFMKIVGSDPAFEAGVFTGVHIGKDFKIIVDTRHGRQLDTDFELNGASQRALTLAYIWALTEVSGVAAPRIIDTPLGMVAGGVKTRMVETITRPDAAGGANFQVVLLLTRSEIRDIEPLLDQRAGLIRTLSCSKDYPEDLIHSWGADHPMIRVCGCNHRQSCRVCARKYDSQHGIAFRDEEVTVS